MRTKFFLLLLTCFVITSAFSQTNLNEYKYIIVPNKYDFLKKKDQYQLNSLTKFLFEKYGFQAFIEGQKYPTGLSINRCLALRSDVIKESGLFKTKLKVVLKDCNDQVVFTSIVGESKVKDYSKAFNAALRNAFKSFKALNYNYVPNENAVAMVTEKVEVKNEVAEEIQKLKEEIKTLKEEKTEEVVEAKPKVEEVVETPKVIKPKTKITPKKADSNVLYAQAIENGFQLVDSSPKVVYKIKSTGLNDVFLVENRSAIIYKKGNVWILEFYADNTLLQEELNIKF